MNQTMDKKINKKVLLFSGGLDSYLTYRLFKPDVLLYCACGHMYQSRELKAIKDLKLPVEVDYTLDLEKWERKDAIIPLRNLLFAAVASRYGDIVWLGALMDEINPDKSQHFMHAAGLAMTKSYEKSYWSEGREVYVESPVKFYTKARLIYTALQSGIKQEEWAKTVSCYSKQGFCGECSSCFKRWVAHTLNGLHEVYEKHPINSTVSMTAIGKVVKGTYTGIRAEEIATAIAYYSKKEIKWPNKELRDRVIPRVEKMKTGVFEIPAPMLQA